MSVFDHLEALVLANSPGETDVTAAIANNALAPSVSMAVLQEGKITSRCYSTIGDNTETIFQACSISKPINALAVMKLIDQGRFTLSSTIADLLPKGLLDILVEGSPASLRPIVEGITVKQLLSHTAGLTVHGFIGYSSRDKVPAVRQIIEGTFPCNSARIRLGALPGHSFSYSGGGITVLQIIVETVTGKDYPTALQDLVLQPLGMTRSHYGPLPPGENNAAEAHFTQHTKADVDHHIMPELAAAGLWTTPTDLLKAVAAVQSSLKDLPGAFLQKETTNAMLEKPKSGSMALSWARPTGAIFQHDGSNEPGFRSIMYGFAKLEDDDAPENCGFVIMVNGGDDGYLYAWKLALAIAKFHDWPLTATASYLKSIAPLRPIDNGPSSEAWKDWKGAWDVEDAAASQRYMVDEAAGKPVLFYGGVGPIALLRTAEEKVYDVEGLRMTVTMGEKEGKKELSIRSALSGGSIDLKQLDN